MFLCIFFWAAHEKLQVMAKRGESRQKGMAVNSLRGPGSIYKHGEMLFKISDLTDYRYKLFTRRNGAPKHAVFTRLDVRYTCASLEP